MTPTKLPPENPGRFKYATVMIGGALIPNNVNISELDALIIKVDDTRWHPLGIKGMGEIGSIGGPAAIGNTIFHATGVRLTELPFRIDSLLAGMTAV